MLGNDNQTSSDDGWRQIHHGAPFIRGHFTMIGALVCFGSADRAGWQERRNAHRQPNLNSAPTSAASQIYKLAFVLAPWPPRIYLRPTLHCDLIASSQSHSPMFGLRASAIGALAGAVISIGKLVSYIEYIYRRSGGAGVSARLVLPRAARFHCCRDLNGPPCWGAPASCVRIILLVKVLQYNVCARFLLCRHNSL